MSAIVQNRMTGDEFIAWAMEQPEDGRYELVRRRNRCDGAGRGRRTPAQRAVSLPAWTRSIRASSLPCEAFPDGMTVHVDARHHLSTRCCGPVRRAPLDDNATEISDPVILVEVRVAFVTQARHRRKARGLFPACPSVRHYLIVKTENQVIIHHQRDEGGIITTTIIRDGAIRLDPPGLVLTDLFPPSHTIGQ